MRALPARRVALGALCAAFLAGVTGPTAMAADPAPGQHRATSSDALLVQVRNLDAHEDELAPVVDLLEAALEADDGHLSPAEAGRLGEAAKDALEKVAAQAPADTDPPATTDTPAAPDTPATTDTPTAADTPAAPDPAVDTLLPDTAADPTSDALDAAGEAVDSLVDLLLSDDAEDADQVPWSVDDLLTRVDDLVGVLVGDEPQVSILPAPAGTAPSAQGSLLPVVTLPALTSLTPVLLPAS
ncbi:hypothetical protein GCM10010294_02970 [Streptomyces griseoloalbus]|uniref:hypothetical protein n=1 Tax=Streptomyces griseoloalbus TaxID=67303 RepID=UPI001873B826|nr:hypothetical protein GCM10010294_02970 [Streptomyces griseoloalbus]